ncbi:hypothetical protein [Arthrobacter sp. NicSoilB8]|uniref:hypothetical protein n=1 Tax=Arthrobacter sp. NicSoilB8 TaxID=2830998 RepID=UPI001CC61FDB|nr:hypothetical protein [Arthrobacter sp. NicSoilB8]BCW71114.1 hypothetical protein NicSoilB8_21580 [Arthrobacter sp. NicSoilB8]
MATSFKSGSGKVPAQRVGPTVARQATGTARTEATQALAGGRARTGRPAGTAVGPNAFLALQRLAGNAAVGALVAAKLKSPAEQAATEIDAALKEIRRDEPAIATVEKGLKAAKAVGVPVELEGPKPPAAALAVTKTGFGPGSVPAKKPVPPPKPVPAVSPLGKAAAAKVGGQGKDVAGGKALGPAPAGGAAAPAIMAPAALPADKLFQPPVAPSPVRPDEDPAFTRVTGSIKGFARAKKAHPPAASKAREAQGAALPPTDDVAGQAKAAKVDTMDAQQPGTFDKQGFIAAVKAAIEAKSPKTLEEADEYKKSGKAGEAKGEVKGLVGQGKAGQAKDIEAATGAPPDQSKAVPKPVTPMAQEQPGQAAPVPAAGAVPKPAPAEQLNLAAGPHQANQEMADAGVSEPQLAQSNEPEFQQGLADKNAAAEHARTAPAEFRQQEQQVLQQGKAEAGAQTAAGVNGMQTAKATALAHLVADKGKTKSKDESKRAEVTAKVQSIFAATEAEVKKTLDGIDPKVDKAFETGEAAARSMFEAYVGAKMSAYKKDRYGGWLGGYRWLRDKIAGMPAKVNEFYEAGRELYLRQMNVVISNVADIVGNDLTAAKQRIARGKTEIASYVKSLPSDLQKVGSEATKEIGDKFDALESDVNAKQESVVDALATKYVEARKGLDERIEALQAENKGLVDKAIGAIKAIINTIRELAAMLRNVLSRAAGVVGDIIKNPVAFLGNLIEGVKGGILKFKDNILGHLKKGLMGWLFGALAEGGVELPDTFDIKGIIKLLASIFGLTWANIRNRIVKQIGEKAMAAVEKGVEIFQVIASQGLAGLWQMLLEKLGNIKDMILEQVKDFVITKIITAGITWLIGLLNPAAAFIKACKLIYDVVMFFVTNAERIMKFVNTIIDSVADIVRGNVSSVVNKIEDVLGQMVPILIGFLASVIGIGGIGQKVRQIIETLQKPVNKALDFVIKTGLKLAGPIIRGIKGFAGKVKAKVAAGKAWVKGKAEAGKAWAKKKVTTGVAAIRDTFFRRLARKRSVPMEGRTHELFVGQRSGGYKVMLASTPSELIARIDRAASSSKAKGTPGVLGRLSTARAKVVRAESLFLEAMQIGDDMKRIRDTESSMIITVDQIEAEMIDLGKTFDISELTGGKYVLDDQVHPDYRRKERQTFYGPSRVYQQHVGAVRQKTINERNARYPDPTKVADRFWCPGVVQRNRYAHLARFADGYAVDHIVGAATHWKNGDASLSSRPGNNSGQTDRVSWYGNIDNLQLLCKACNDSKQSLGDHYDPPVGKDFTGPNGLR